MGKESFCRLVFRLIGLVCVVLTGVQSVLADSLRDTLDLSGNWAYQLVGASPSIPGEGMIFLPNTLDYARKSEFMPPSDNTTQLRREFNFAGEATYSRNIVIPNFWNGKEVELVLERTKPSIVIINGDTVGYNSRISSPQRFDVTKFLKPGENKIEITVNNNDSLPPIVRRSSNATAEGTQTNWNGILGEMLLEAKNPFNLKEIKFKEDFRKKSLELTAFFSEKSPKNLKLKASLNSETTEVKIPKGSDSVSFIIPLENIEWWSDKNPALYDLDLTIYDSFDNAIDSRKIKTGFRQFINQDKGFTINGNPVFLRGTINSAIFPITAFPPTTIEEWTEYFEKIKEYGFNHIRFHSWTPPQAAFEAADRLGVFLQTELPIWGELDRDLNFHNRFLKEELEGIMESYSQHPSFVLFSNGNELWGDLSLMGEYMKEAKAKNPRLLTTYGTNVYLGMNGQIGEEDFVVSAKTDDNPESAVRGSLSFADSPSGGYLNSHRPNSSHDFSKSTRFINVPVIAHEVGQYQIYPDFSEIDKYVGLLKPDNLLEFKKRADEAGTLRKNHGFSLASGQWAAKLYKAEMEMALRNPGLAGFQLFGLQDYPGQGTSLIGILDPFMDSKGYISKEEWNESNGDIVLLAKFPKFTFFENESVRIPLTVANYSQSPLDFSAIEWETPFASGVINSISVGQGLLNADGVSLTMPSVESPVKMKLNLRSRDNSVSNSYDFWVYPRMTPPVDKVYVTSDMDEALHLLKGGQRVILCPDSASVANASIPGLFVNDFWNYRMFRTICDEMELESSPGTLGLYIETSHPALQKFPTDNHTDWQWYSIIKNSRPLIIDRLPKEIDPIVEVIDNVERNFRLALMLECNVGKGKLLILSTDLNELEKNPEGKWLLQSIKEYVASKEFKPDLALTPKQVINLLTKPSRARLIKELKNETYNSHWD